MSMILGVTIGNILWHCFIKNEGRKGLPEALGKSVIFAILWGIYLLVTA